MAHLCDLKVPFGSFMMIGLFSLSSLVTLDVRMMKHGKNYIYLSHISQTPNLLETIFAQWPAPVISIMECLEMILDN